MRTLKTLLSLLLLASIAYKATAYYQYRMAAAAAPPQVKTVKARSGELRITLSGSGMLQPQEMRTVAVREVQSTIVRIIEDGDMVKAGQEVCQLDTTALVKDLHDRQAAYDTAKAAMATTEADLLLNVKNAETKVKKSQEDQRLLLSTNRATTEQAQSLLKFNGSELKQAERQKDRKESLARDQLVPEIDAESANLNAQSKKVSVVTATKKLEVQQQTEKIGTSQGEMLIEDAKYSSEAAKNKAQQQVENAKFNALQAQRQLELTQLQIQWCTIHAPIAGLAVVQREWDRSTGSLRPLRGGDQVFPSRRLMDIIDTSRMLVEADVGEIDIGHVRAGQAARVFPRAAPGLTLRARVKSVSEIAQAPEVWRTSRLPGKKVFRVVLTVLDGRPQLLRPGMTADFELVEEAIAGAVRVPIEVVFPDQVFRSSGAQVFRSTKSKSGPPQLHPEHPNTGVVYVRKDGRYWPKAVVLGKRNDNDVQVLKGLKAGEVLAAEKPPASLIGAASHQERQPKLSGLLSLLPWGMGR